MRSLQQRNLRNGEYPVTFFGFGALEIGRNWGLGSGAEVERPDEAAASEVLNAVLDMGVTLVDTASAYHASEERIGRAIAHRRGEYILTSKCGEHSDEPRTYYDYSYDAIAGSIDRSLQLLQTDSLDLIQIHFGPDPDEVLDAGETLAAMKDARAAGKVRLLGASIGGDVAARCIESGDFDVMQLGYSLLHRDDEPLVHQCGKMGIGVLIRGGLGAGRLTPRVVPHLDEMDEPGRQQIQRLLRLVDDDASKLTALALQFLYANPAVTSVLVGSKRAEHLRANMELLDLDLGDALAEAQSLN
jgi:aryl-alcohol dehydrogenase-like predicted oxidoreductase